MGRQEFYTKHMWKPHPLVPAGIYVTMSAISIRRVPSGVSSFYMGSGVRISRKGELHADHVHCLYPDPRLHPPLCGGKRLVYHKLLRSREYCGPKRGLCPLGSYGRDLFLRLFKKDLPPHAGKAAGTWLVPLALVLLDFAVTTPYLPEMFP